MLKSFKTFWKDYNDMIVKPQTKWMKLHWKGYILMLVTFFAGGYAIGKVYENKVNKDLDIFNLDYNVEEDEEP